MLPGDSRHVWLPAAPSPPVAGPPGGRHPRGPLPSAFPISAVAAADGRNPRSSLLRAVTRTCNCCVPFRGLAVAACRTGWLTLPPPFPALPCPLQQLSHEFLRVGLDARCCCRSPLLRASTCGHHFHVLLPAVTAAALSLLSSTVASIDLCRAPSTSPWLPGSTCALVPLAMEGVTPVSKQLWRRPEELRLRPLTR